MAAAARPVQPAFARMASAALLMDTVDLAFDAGESRRAHPWLPCTPVSRALQAVLGTAQPS